MSDLFIGIKGHAVCISKETGEEKWRTKLKSMANVTNICFDEDNVYAYTHGYLFCLNPKDGTILWENGLSGLGHSHCIIAAQTNQQQIIAASSIDQNATTAGTS